jgi:transcriptional regulator
MGEFEFLPGTLDLLILRTLAHGPMHGYGIVAHLQRSSEDVFAIGESSLYPALQRLRLKRWVTTEWGTSDNNRRARYYTLTPTGRAELAREHREFDRLVGAIRKVLNAT